MVSSALLDFAARGYGFPRESLRFIGNSTNDIYYFEKDGAPFALRFARRPAAEAPLVAAEMEFLYYLHDHGLSVALPLPIHGDWLAVASDGGESCIVTAFSWLSGRNWDKRDPAVWNEALFRRWGRLMGDMHRLARDYRPAGARRGEFTGREALSESVWASPVADLARVLTEEMRALPRDEASWGLIHNDLHPWNFLIEGERLNVFDFDDCLYGPFALDIGVALYHGLWWGRPEGDAPRFARLMINGFLDGYQEANRLPRECLSRVPLCMRYRQMCKFSWFYRPGQADAETETRLANMRAGRLFTDLTTAECAAIIEGRG